MSAEFGSKCDMISSSMNEVSRNCIWREHVTKELRGLKLNTDFQISDPHNMQVIPQKPNQIIPVGRPDTETIRRCTENLDKLCSTHDREVPPCEKYKLPLTSANELGFWNKYAAKDPNTMFDHKRHAGDVTKYADSYVTMTGRSPFSRVDFSPE